MYMHFVYYLFNLHTVLNLIIKFSFFFLLQISLKFKYIMYYQLLFVCAWKSTQMNREIVHK